MVKKFFLATAAFELLTAFTLMFAPSLTTLLLIGTSVDTPAAIVVCRVAAAALFTIAIACWYARSEEQSRATFGLLVAMLFYNVVVILVLVYGAVNASLVGIGFYPAAIAHAALAGWCIACLLKKPAQ